MTSAVSSPLPSMQRSVLAPRASAPRGYDGTPKRPVPRQDTLPTERQRPVHPGRAEPSVPRKGQLRQPAAQATLPTLPSTWQAHPPPLEAAHPPSSSPRWWLHRSRGSHWTKSPQHTKACSALNCVSSYQTETATPPTHPPLDIALRAMSLARVAVDSRPDGTVLPWRLREIARHGVAVAGSP